MSKLLGGNYRSRRTRRSRALSVESLETRQVLAGNVFAELSNGVLDIRGDNLPNGILVEGVEKAVTETYELRSGTTSVYLDTETLSSVGLNLTGADSTGTPFSPATPQFQVGFPIDPSTNFEFSVDGGFAPVGGTIEHTGTVTFNGDTDDPITVGDFSIGFDPSRIMGDASGFYVEDTFSGLGILFDLSAPSVVDFDDPDVTIATPDLLVSPELAEILENSALVGADVGDARIDGVAAPVLQRRVDDGTTSVFLNVDLLASAANLQVSSIVSNGSPASSDFQVGFPIEPSSDFEFSINGALDLEGGFIRHTGTVGFNNDSIIVGDFAIGFDATRATDDTSGFYVEDTVGGLGILFDVGIPTAFGFDDPDLQIGAELRVSPEFAGILQAVGLVAPGTDLTGAVVGNAQIDALVVPQVETHIVVSEFLGGRINGGRSASFPADQVMDIAINTRMGNDFVRVRDLHFAGDIDVDVEGGFLNYVQVNHSVLSGAMSVNGGTFGERVEVTDSWIQEMNVDLGSGVDLVSLYDSQLGDMSVTSNNGFLQQIAVWRSTVTGDLNVNLNGLFTWTNVYYSQLNNLNIDNGRGNDLVSLISSNVARDARISLDGGWDRVMFFRSNVNGSTEIDGGDGLFDRLDAYFSDLGSYLYRGFESARV